MKERERPGSEQQRAYRHVVRGREVEDKLEAVRRVPKGRSGPRRPGASGPWHDSAGSGERVAAGGRPRPDRTQAKCRARGGGGGGPVMQ